MCGIFVERFYHPSKSLEGGYVIKEVLCKFSFSYNSLLLGISVKYSKEGILHKVLQSSSLQPNHGLERKLENNLLTFWISQAAACFKLSIVN